jgi:hypothetical protein
VFHTANAPAVDIEFQRTGRPWKFAGFRDVANGQSASRRLYRGSWDVTIAAAGTDDVVFGPVTLDLEGGTAYLAYAVGTLESNTFTVLLGVAEDLKLPNAEALVVHGLPGEEIGLDPALPVDISVNGMCLLQGFGFGDVAGPVSLPEGSYHIAIALANMDDPCGNDPVLQADDVMLMGGESYSIVAHLTESGNATASVFPNVLTGRGPYSIINVFHGAKAPAVDVEFSRWFRSEIISDLINGEQDFVSIRRGWSTAAIFPAGGDTPVLGPVPFPVDGATTYLIYAVGSLESESLSLIVETLGGDDDDDDDYDDDEEDDDEDDD